MDLTRPVINAVDKDNLIWITRDIRRSERFPLHYQEYFDLIPGCSLNL